MGPFLKFALELFVGIASIVVVKTFTDYYSRTESENRETTTQYRTRPFNSGDSIPVQPNYNCVICLEQIVSPLEILPCSHVFHRQCIKDWFENSKTCPICNYNLTSVQIQEYRSRL